MNKIESLTPEQEALFPAYVERFLKIGYDNHTDRDKAEAAAKLAYEKAGVPWPGKVVWFDSPLGQALGYAIFDKVLPEQLKNDSVVDSVRVSVRDSVWNSVRASVWNSVWASVWDSVRASVGDSVWNSVKVSVWNSVEDSVWASVWDSVRASVGDSVGASVWNSVRDSVSDSVVDSVGDSVRVSVWNSVGDSVKVSVWNSVEDSVWASVWDSVSHWYRNQWEGSHLAHISGFCSYFSEQLGLDLSKFDGLAAVIRECGWVYFGKNVVLLSPKPIETHVTPINGRNVLHNEYGPAVLYPDTWGVWAYEGVRLHDPKYHIPVKQWDPKWILEERNADIRSKLIKGVGYERFIAAVGAKTVDSDTIADLPYELLTWNDPDVGEMKFLKMKNPSVPGVYHVEPVAPYDWINTCYEALAWRLGAEKPGQMIDLLFKA